MGTASVQQGGGRFIAGDPLRGLACLGVVFFHAAMAASQIIPPHIPSAGLTDQLGAAGPPIQSGVLGFWFFFILSAYLLSQPFLRTLLFGAPAPHMARYARNRALRLIPAFWFVLTLTILVVGTQGNTVRQMVAFYGFAHVYDMGPFTPRMVQAWTLDVEVAFYLVLPLVLLTLAWLVRGRLSAWGRAAMVLAVCAIVGVLSIRMGVGGPSSGRCVPGSAWAFALGITIATLELMVRPKLPARSARIGAYALAAVAVAAFVVRCVLVADAAGPVLLNVIAAICCGSLLAAPLLFQWATGRSWSVIDNRPLQWFGERAFGVFLIHVLVLYELRHLISSLGSVPKAMLVVTPLALLISTVAGALIYRFIEQPFLGRRVSWRTPAQPAVQPAPAQP